MYKIVSGLTGMGLGGAVAWAMFLNWKKSNRTDQAGETVSGSYEALVKRLNEEVTRLDKKAAECDARNLAMARIITALRSQNQRQETRIQELEKVIRLRGYKHD